MLFLNAYLDVKIGFDSAENEPPKECKLAPFSSSGHLHRQLGGREAHAPARAPGGAGGGAPRLRGSLGRGARRGRALRRAPAPKMMNSQNFAKF